MTDKIKIKKRKKYRHRMANPKVGWTREYQKAWENIFESDEVINATKEK